MTSNDGSSSAFSSFFSFLIPSSQSHKTALLIGSVAVVSSVTTASVIFGIQSTNRKSKRADLEERVRRATRESGLGHSSNEKDHHSNSSTLSHSLLKHKSSKHLGIPNSRSSLLSRNAARSSDDAESMTTEGGTPRYLSMIQGGGGSSSITPSSSSLSIPRRRENYDESLIREQLTRNYSFLGEEGMSKVRNSFVVIVGAGGVGSWAALMLLRSGISNIRIIDFDQVSLSSLNRHACADLADVGRPKVQVCADKFLRIAPWANVEPCAELFTGSEASRLLGPSQSVPGLPSRTPDYVFDAIDNIDTKVDLIAYCYERRIPVFSSMGAGAKSDASRIQIGDISMTYEDPLSRTVRRKLRSLGIPSLPPKESQEQGVSYKLETKHNDGEKKRLERKKKEEEELELAKKTSSVELDNKDKNQQSSSKSTSSKSTGSIPTKGSLARKDRTNPPPSRSASQAQVVATSSFSNSSKPIEINAKPSSSSSTQFLSHSRRPSSASSFGSAAYETPLTSPRLSTPNLEENQSNVPSLDGMMGSAALEKSKDEDHEEAVEDGEEFEDEITNPTQEEIEEKAQELVDSQEDDGSYFSQQTGRESSSSSRRKFGRSSTQVEELVPEDIKSNMRNLPPTPNPSTPFPRGVTSKETDWVIPCVYSTEKSDTRLLPLPEEEFQKGKVEELAALEDFRVRILPVLGPLPAMFGMAAATYIICELAEHPHEPLPFRGRRPLYERLHKELVMSELQYPYSSQPGQAARLKINRQDYHLPFTVNDICYIFEELFHGRSVVPPFESLSTAKLLRWDPSLPLSYSNIALFSKKEGKKHEKDCLSRGVSPFEVWGEDTTNMVRRRQASERGMGLLR